MNDFHMSEEIHVKTENPRVVTPKHQKSVLIFDQYIFPMFCRISFIRI